MKMRIGTYVHFDNEEIGQIIGIMPANEPSCDYVYRVQWESGFCNLYYPDELVISDYNAYLDFEERSLERMT